MAAKKTETEKKTEPKASPYIGRGRNAKERSELRQKRALARSKKK